ncbi:conserved Plasmodium protein, unknown function [Plasmodium knowlesi strain H]|uniref:Uncharacterized protein n=3 Tax=Plasmodium knowlesi TaxID=5850 RepID=A0A5K1UDA4_PLAKH|nr:uncharacterized protein PKNH_1403800 [Plasmodium knowlesi strain H]OTN63688.1 Uncharacterized protein PKNOH_S140220900 [Plasmodium knowlesi]CAA9990637.1 conserved Plasmodium protein, unknown function [Plasmodium knowlesi strain H]SBO26012.1 conserved Plasmodium protein, unknown function [Plasmodium knowlesi strain H]SBO28721.1 conserved Plasmodium protein, unknown function [Plasmodium knowlesi strain H]VVS80111.1 conserved Plasmodium protein, unknown function [Plasmodium knowlesi strain H]|eukprot:XP_002261928.1 [Plasmodium knowlesi strain H]
MTSDKHSNNFFSEFNIYHKKNTKKVVYRYFQNRTQKQTKYITLSLLGLSGLFLYITNKAYDRNIFYLNNEVYKKFSKNYDASSPLEAQNRSFARTFVKAKRKNLELDSKPLVSQIIRIDEKE